MSGTAGVPGDMPGLASHGGDHVVLLLDESGSIAAWSAAQSASWSTALLYGVVFS